MPSKEVSFYCSGCKCPKQETVYYTPDEELQGKFYMRIWGGVFVFGITVLLFVWALVLMLKTFEMKKLEKVLEDPNVQYEDTWVGQNSDNPNFKTDTIRVLKAPKGGVVAMPGIESLQKELDQAKKNASEDRKHIQELLQDTDQLIKAYKELEQLTQEKKLEVEKVEGSAPKQWKGKP